jgi:hypothetical protein
MGVATIYEHYSTVGTVHRLGLGLQEGRPTKLAITIDHLNHDYQENIASRKAGPLN